MLVTFAEKPMPKNSMQNWLRDKRSDFITKQMWPQNSPKLNLWILWKMSDKQNLERVFKATESLRCS